MEKDVLFNGVALCLNEVSCVYDRGEEGDVDHAREFFTLGIGIGQIGAVDGPVIVTTTVETVLFPALLVSIFPLLSFSPGTGYGLCLVEASLAAATAVTNASAAVALPFCAKAIPPPLSPPGLRC